MIREARVRTQLAPPRFSDAQAAVLLSECYGIEGSLLTPLPSERDQNYRVTTRSAEQFVLKISESAENPPLVDCQTGMLDRLAAARSPFLFPQVVPDPRGRTVSRAVGPDGDSHLVRLLRFVAGVPLGRVRRRTPDLLTQVGTLVGTISRVLDGFETRLPTASSNGTSGSDPRSSRNAKSPSLTPHTGRWYAGSWPLSSVMDGRSCRI